MLLFVFKIIWRAHHISIFRRKIRMALNNNNYLETFFIFGITYTIIILEVSPMCNSCNNRGNSCSSIIWIILLYYVLGDNSCCDSDCGCGNNRSFMGGSNNCSWIIILILLWSCGGNGFSLGNNYGCGNSCMTPRSCGCENRSCGCDNVSSCGCN